MKNNKNINTIDIIKILNKYNIKQVVRKGDEISFCCPFHDDSTPSAFINIKNKFFKCFGCSAKGNIITFISKLEKKSYNQVLEELESGVEEDIDYNDKMNVLKDKIVDRRKNQDNSKNKYSDIYRFLIDKSEPMIETNSDEYSYLRDTRGLTNDIIHKQNIRLITNETVRHLFKQFDDKSLSEAKLINSETKRFVGSMHRIAFPFYYGDEISSIQLRGLTNSKLKYLNIGKLKIPYNINVILESDTIALCEGVIDCLTLLQMGKSAIGIIGASNFDKEWIKYFIDKKVVIFFDNDTPGQKAANKIKLLLKNNDIEVVNKKLSKYNDINEWYVNTKL